MGRFIPEARIVHVIMVRGAQGRDSHTVRGAAVVYQDRAPTTIIVHSAPLLCFN